MIKQIIQWSQGNPGAMTFLMQLMESKNPVESLQISLKLEECKSIRGTNLYVLWSDLCNKDLNEVFNLCTKIPNQILEDACNRQDYSGRKIIEDYLKSV